MPASDGRTRLLVLWDIDHTLIETRGVGFTLYKRAFEAATGQELRQLAKIEGRTELDITVQSLRLNGIEPTDEVISTVTTELAHAYDEHRGELASTGRALPGAKETLAGLAGRRGFYQSVLTGNLRVVARVKLEVFGLDKFVDLEAGAYGEDSHDRAELVHIAQRRAQARADERFPNDRTVLVGDTINDVRAAREAGVGVVGVATGKASEAELRDAGATAVFACLTEVEAHLLALTPGADELSR
ncbi:MAG TPA: haloacid dehalogenase-like hydrolase [Actinokineospora sp.]|jgi:phosphoglycolate phosphatase-like HAD superfamily hydrolase|nr:haloacid dehalogenase-like hydrolase [Actinokineospora sp.]